MKYFLFILLLLPCILKCQNVTLPEPRCGWDSLNAKIKYPWPGFMSGHNIALRANLYIDSTGRMINLSVEPFSGRYSINNIDFTCPLSSLDSLFIDVIINALNSVEWWPGTIDGFKRPTYLDIPIIFNSYEYGTPYSQRRMIVIDTVRRKLEKNRLSP